MESISPNAQITKKLARRAYELGRLKFALRSLLWVVPLTGFSILFCGRLNFSLFMGSLLAIATIVFWWLGRMWRLGALLGAMAGTLAASLLILSHLAGICCVYDLEFGFCVLSGTIGGAVVSTRAIKRNESQHSYLLAAGTILLLSGALGCAVLGTSGLLGFAMGAVATSAPIILAGNLKFAS